jgi:plastocyanin
MRRIFVMGLAVTASLVLAACAGGSGAGGSVAPSTGAEPAPAADVCAAVTTAGDVQGTIQGNAYDPSAVALTVGQSVTFTNADGVGHTLTLDDGTCDTGTIAGGASGTLQFNAAGSYPFHCAIHPTMKGTVEVT